MRGKAAPIRKIVPDNKYNNTLVTKLINYVMRGGKKTVAQAVVYGAFDKVAEKTKSDALEVFERAMAMVHQRNQDIFGCLSDKEQATLSGLFDRLIAHARPR